MASDSAGAAPKDQSFDFKLISDILMQLNITRKNTKMYPKGHPQLEASFTRVMKLLEEHFDYHEELPLAITGATILVGDYELPRGNPIFRELAGNLHDMSVYSFVLKRGLSGDELQTAYRVLLRDPQVALPGESLQDQLLANGVRNVEVCTLAWCEEDFTEEEVVELGSEGAEEGAVGASWTQFVKRLLAKDAQDFLVDSEEGIELTDVDPEVLAQFLNKLERTGDQSLSYDKVVANYVAEVRSGESGAGRMRDNEVRAGFVDLVRNLHSGLRTELLAKNLKFSKRSPDVSMDILETQRGRVVMRVLEKMNKAGRELDPKVLELVDKLAGYRSAAQAPAAPEEEMTPRQEEVFEKQVAAFLTASAFRGTTDAKQRRVLAQVAHADIVADMGPELIAEPLSELAETIRTTEIGGHYANCLLDLLERSPEPKAAEAFAQALAEFIARYTTDGYWELVISTWRELAAIEDSVEERRLFVVDACEKVRNQYWNKDNVSLISRAILEYGVHRVGELADILRLSGASFAGEIVGALAIEEDPAVRKVLLGIVRDLDEHTRPYVLRGLNVEEPFVVRNMLMAVQQVGMQEALPQLAVLLKHEDPGVRLEALRTALVLGHDKATELLIGAMDDADMDVALGAVELAGYVRHSDVVVALVRIVKSRIWKNPEREFRRQQKAVEALARLQSEYALMELYDLVAAKRLLNSKEYDELKVEIYRSLTHYDSDKVDQFIEFGKKSKDARIANLCSSLEGKRRRKRSKQE